MAVLACLVFGSSAGATTAAITSPTGGSVQANSYPGPIDVTATPVAPSFIGHGCTISTCRFFTSSYHTARYFYDRRTCNQWKSLSRTYLRGYNTVLRLHQDFPNRVRHAAC
jgi:hypothetical protein